MQNMFTRSHGNAHNETRLKSNYEALRKEDGGWVMSWDDYDENDYDCYGRRMRDAGYGKAMPDNGGCSDQFDRSCEQADFIGAYYCEMGSKTAGYFVPVDVDMSFLNVYELFSQLDYHINRLTKSGWSAFSTKNGLVYFQVDIVWKTILQMAKQCQRFDLAMAEVDKHLQASYLIAAVNKIYQSGDYLAKSYIGKNFYAAPFHVHFHDGSVWRNKIYLPLKIETFTQDTAKLEARKKGRLRQIKWVEIAKRSPR